MSSELPRPSRRRFLGACGLGAAALLWRPGVFAEELARTARTGEGPFYPHILPLDTDNDLVIVNNSITPAIGEITHVSGRLLDPGGNPIRNAVVEIWQVDHDGTYLEQHTAHGAPYDENFQGFGRFLTGSTGEYRFRTIKPVVYAGRQAPHIHFAVKRTGAPNWATQLYIKGHPGNARDGIYRQLGSDEAKASVTVDFRPLPESRIGELTAKFDIVLGLTPEDQSA